MKFDHTVKYNGEYYPAGAEVPMLDEKPVIGETEESTEDSEEGTEEAKETGKQWTKTEINRMSAEELRKLAVENGIVNAEEISGVDLKKMLIEKFGL